MTRLLIEVKLLKSLENVMLRNPIEVLEDGLETAFSENWNAAQFTELFKAAYHKKYRTKFQAMLATLNTVQEPDSAPEPTHCSNIKNHLFSDVPNPALFHCLENNLKLVRIILGDPTQSELFLQRLYRMMNLGGSPQRLFDRFKSEIEAAYNEILTENKIRYRFINDCTQDNIRTILAEANSDQDFAFRFMLLCKYQLELLLENSELTDAIESDIEFPDDANRNRVIQKIRRYLFGMSENPISNNELLILTIRRNKTILLKLCQTNPVRFTHLLNKTIDPCFFIQTTMEYFSINDRPEFLFRAALSIAQRYDMTNEQLKMSLTLTIGKFRGQETILEGARRFIQEKIRINNTVIEFNYLTLFGASLHYDELRELLAYTPEQLVKIISQSGISIETHEYMAFAQNGDLYDRLKKGMPSYLNPENVLSNYHYFYAVAAIRAHQPYNDVLRVDQSDDEAAIRADQSDDEAAIRAVQPNNGDPLDLAGCILISKQSYFNKFKSLCPNFHYLIFQIPAVREALIRAFENNNTRPMLEQRLPTISLQELTRDAVVDAVVRFEPLIAVIARDSAEMMQTLKNQFIEVCLTHSLQQTSYADIILNHLLAKAATGEQSHIIILQMIEIAKNNATFSKLFEIISAYEQNKFLNALLDLRILNGIPVIHNPQWVLEVYATSEDTRLIKPLENFLLEIGTAENYLFWIHQIRPEVPFRNRLIDEKGFIILTDPTTAFSDARSIPIELKVIYQELVLKYFDKWLEDISRLQAALNNISIWLTEEVFIRKLSNQNLQMLLIKSLELRDSQITVKLIFDLMLQRKEIDFLINLSRTYSPILELCFDASQVIQKIIWFHDENFNVQLATQWIQKLFSDIAVNSDLFQRYNKFRQLMLNDLLTMPDGAELLFLVSQRANSFMLDNIAQNESIARKLFDEIVLPGLWQSLEEGKLDLVWLTQLLQTFRSLRFTFIASCSDQARLATILPIFKQQSSSIAGSLTIKEMHSLFSQQFLRVNRELSDALFVCFSLDQYWALVQTHPEVISNSPGLVINLMNDQTYLNQLLRHNQLLNTILTLNNPIINDKLIQSIGSSKLRNFHQILGNCEILDDILFNNGAIQVAIALHLSTRDGICLLLQEEFKKSVDRILRTQNETIRECVIEAAKSNPKFLITLLAREYFKEEEWQKIQEEIISLFAKYSINDSSYTIPYHVVEQQLKKADNDEIITLILKNRYLIKICRVNEYVFTPVQEIFIRENLKLTINTVEDLLEAIMEEENVDQPIEALRNPHPDHQHYFQQVWQGANDDLYIHELNEKIKSLYDKHWRHASKHAWTINKEKESVVNLAEPSLTPSPLDQSFEENYSAQMKDKKYKKDFSTYQVQYEKFKNESPSRSSTKKNKLSKTKSLGRNKTSDNLTVDLLRTCADLLKENEALVESQSLILTGFEYFTQSINNEKKYESKHLAMLHSIRMATSEVKEKLTFSTANQLSQMSISTADRLITPQQVESINLTMARICLQLSVILIAQLIQRSEHYSAKQYAELNGTIQELILHLRKVRERKYFAYIFRCVAGYREIVKPAIEEIELDLHPCLLSSYELYDLQAEAALAIGKIPEAMGILKDYLSANVYDDHFANRPPIYLAYSVLFNVLYNDRCNSEKIKAYLKKILENNVNGDISNLIKKQAVCLLFQLNIHTFIEEGNDEEASMVLNNFYEDYSRWFDEVLTSFSLSVKVVLGTKNKILITHILSEPKLVQANPQKIAQLLAAAKNDSIYIGRILQYYNHFSLSQTQRFQLIADRYGVAEKPVVSELDIHPVITSTTTVKQVAEGPAIISSETNVNASANLPPMPSAIPNAPPAPPMPSAIPNAPLPPPIPSEIPSAPPPPSMPSEIPNAPPPPPMPSGIPSAPPPPQFGKKTAPAKPVEKVKNFTKEFYSLFKDEEFKNWVASFRHTKEANGTEKSIESIKRDFNNSILPDLYPLIELMHYQGLSPEEAFKQFVRIADISNKIVRFIQFKQDNENSVGRKAFNYLAEKIINFNIELFNNVFKKIDINVLLQKLNWNESNLTTAIMSALGGIFYALSIGDQKKISDCLGNHPDLSNNINGVNIFEIVSAIHMDYELILRQEQINQQEIESLDNKAKENNAALMKRVPINAKQKIKEIFLPRAQLESKEYNEIFNRYLATALLGFITEYQQNSELDLIAAYVTFRNAVEQQIALYENLGIKTDLQILDQQSFNNAVDTLKTIRMSSGKALDENAPDMMSQLMTKVSKKTGSDLPFSKRLSKDQYQKLQEIFGFTGQDSDSAANFVANILPRLEPLFNKIFTNENVTDNDIKIEIDYWLADENFKKTAIEENSIAINDFETNFSSFIREVIADQQKQKEAEIKRSLTFNPLTSRDSLRPLSVEASDKPSEENGNSTRVFDGMFNTEMVKVINRRKVINGSSSESESEDYSFTDSDDEQHVVPQLIPKTDQTNTQQFFPPPPNPDPISLPKKQPVPGSDHQKKSNGFAGKVPGVKTVKHMFSKQPQIQSDGGVPKIPKNTPPPNVEPTPEPTHSPKKQPPPGASMKKKINPFKGGKGTPKMFKQPPLKQPPQDTGSEIESANSGVVPGKLPKWPPPAKG